MGCRRKHPVFSQPCALLWRPTASNAPSFGLFHRTAMPYRPSPRSEPESETRNFAEMARFVDGAYRTNEAGQRLELRGRDNQPVYAPSQTNVILIPYLQVAGWPELNQRFPQAPEVSMILTPTASADQFIQAIGRGSRRNSQGPTDVTTRCQRRLCRSAPAKSVC